MCYEIIVRNEYDMPSYRSAIVSQDFVNEVYDSECFVFATKDIR